VAAALAEIRAHAAFFKSLGSYPREVSMRGGPKVPASTAAG
jgi:hypothetical protein